MIRCVEYTDILFYAFKYILRRCLYRLYHISKVTLGIEMMKKSWSDEMTRR